MTFAFRDFYCWPMARATASAAADLSRRKIFFFKENLPKNCIGQSNVTTKRRDLPLVGKCKENENGKWPPLGNTARTTKANERANRVTPAARYNQFLSLAIHGSLSSAATRIRSMDALVSRGKWKELNDELREEITGSSMLVASWSKKTFNRTFKELSNGW